MSDSNPSDTSPPSPAPPRRPLLKEPFAAASHLVGAGLALVGAALLLLVAEGVWRLVSFAVYGAGMVFLYTASGLYHSLHLSERGTLRLQKLDHCAIFVMIAGTYTPICLVGLQGPWGWSLLSAVWTMALMGVASLYGWKSAPRWMRLALYGGMGWALVVALKPLSALLPAAGWAWLIAGGLFYSVGMAIYAADRPHLWPGRFTAHDLWHLFVMAGSACHFFFMWSVLT